jgi:hypothetical protein
MAKFYSDIDLLRNQAKGLVLETIAGATPTITATHFDIAGQVYYDSTKEAILVCTASGNADDPGAPEAGTWKRLDFADNSGTIKAGVKLTQPDGSNAGYMEMDFSGTYLDVKPAGTDSGLPVDEDLLAIGLVGGGVKSVTVGQVKTLIQSGRVSLSGNTSGGVATGTGNDNELSVESTLLYSSSVMSIGVGTNSDGAGIKRTARITSGPTGAFTITGQDQVALGEGLSTDKAGGDVNLYAGRGTGTGAGGDILLKTAAPAGATGDALNALSNTWKFADAGWLLVPGAIKSNSDLVFQVDADSGETSKFSFLDGAGTEVMALDESGNLQIDGTLKIDGGTFDFDDVGITAIQTGAEIDSAGDNTGAGWSTDDTSLVTASGIVEYIAAQNFSSSTGNTTNGITSITLTDSVGGTDLVSGAGNATLTITSGGGNALTATNVAANVGYQFVAGTTYPTVTTSGNGSGLTVEFSSVGNQGKLMADTIVVVNAGIGYGASDTFTITPPLGGVQSPLPVGIIATATQELISTVVSDDGVIAINAASATSTELGVASFDGTDFSVTSGAVTIADVALASQVSGTLPVANGGTGADTFTSNALLTGNTTSAIQSEPTLTYSGNELKITSTSNDDTPVIRLESSSTSLDVEPMLDFYRSTPVSADGHNFGQITFRGNTQLWDDDDDAGTPDASTGAVTWGRMLVETASGGFAEGAEEGSLKIGVITNGDAGITDGLTVFGTGTAGRVDLSLGAGATSLTTVKGNLKVTTMGVNSTSSLIGVVSNTGTLETRTLGTMAFAATGDYSNNSGTVESVTAGTGLTDGTSTGNSITTTGTLNLLADQTGISSIYNTGLKIGNASTLSSLIDFSSSSDIAFYVNDANQLKITDGTFTPIADNNIVLGNSTKGFSGLFVNGTIQPSTVGDSEGAVQRDLVIKAGSQTPDLLSVDDPGGALKLYGGMGTGEGAGGNIELHVYKGNAGTGNAANNSVVALTINENKKATFAGAVSVAGAVDITGNTSIAGNLTVTGTTITQNETVQIVTDNTIKFEGTDLIGGDGENSTDLDLTKWTTLSVVEPTGVHNLLLPAASDTLATETFVSGTYAPLTSPGLTGTPTSDATLSAGDDSTSLATTAFVQTELTALGSSSSYWATIDISAQDDQTVPVLFSETLTANITHSLSSNNLLVQLWEGTGTAREEIFAKVTQTNDATVKIVFSHMPAADVHVSILKIGGDELSDDGIGVTYSA